MRIAVWHNLPSGGGKRALHDQIRGLLARGHEIEAWCPPTADQSYLPLGELVPEHVVPLSPVERPPLAAGDLLPRWGSYREVVRFQDAFHQHCREVAALIGAGDFDVVLTGSCWMTAIAPLGRYLRRPSVLYLQEPQRWLYEVTPPLAALPWVAVKLWGRFWWTPNRLSHMAAEAIRIRCLRTVAREELDNLGAFDRVLVNSYFSRESLLRSFGIDARVCGLGIDTELFQPREAPRGDYVVGLGAFGRHKNIELALRALAAVPPPRPRLVWVGNTGDPRYVEELCRMAAHLGVELEPRTLISDPELVAILNGAAMMLYTSRLEPFGFAPLEAAAMETPVVAVAEGGVRETIVDEVNGLVCDADPAQLAAAVQRLRADPALARRLGRQGREGVLRQWSLDRAVERLEHHLIERARAVV